MPAFVLIAEPAGSSDWRCRQIMLKLGEISVPRSIVIVVDDDPAVRNSLKFSLEIEGFAVRTFGCATELLDSSVARLGRCFVVDEKMPGMSGLDLIVSLRARDIVAPAILITSQPSAMVAARAVEARVPIIEKPLLGNALVEQIRDACASSGPTGIEVSR